MHLFFLADVLISIELFMT